MNHAMTQAIADQYFGSTFKVYFLNFDYYADLPAGCDTLEAVKAYVVSKCFEAVVYQNDQRVGFWSPIGGWRD